MPFLFSLDITATERRARSRLRSELLNFFVYSAALEKHPLDTDDRIADMKHRANIDSSNITRCCARVCPEHIHITDNAIIPLKARVVDRSDDPVTRLLRLVTG